MTKAKPKTSSALYSEVRLILLEKPWLTYREVAKSCSTGTTSTVQVYGGYIREEIGCVLKSDGGREVLIINWSKYITACDLYQVEPASVEAVETASCKKREIRMYYPDDQDNIARDEYDRPDKDLINVVYNRLLLEEVIDEAIPGNVGEVLTSKIEAAEIRCSEAQRLVQELSLRLSVAKAQAEEAAEVLRILDELSCMPVSVIQAILG